MTSIPKSTFIILILFALLISLLGSVVFATPVYAASITITTADDELNDDGDCSLREAIQAANTDAAVDACTAGSGADTITVPAGTYTLTIPGTGEDLNATGDLDITGPLTIAGVGAGTTIIQAGTLGYPDFSSNGIDRVFHITGAYTVTIADITIANGKCASCYGGGIGNAGGTLIVVDSTFSGNYGDVGGGIHNDGGTITAMNSTFSNNSAGSGGQGGGIYNYEGNLTATNSTFSGNYANYGGGIINWGVLTLTNSTFADNSAYTEGGGIYNGIAGDTLTMDNTILANSTGLGKDCFNNSGTVAGTNNLIELDGSGGNACGTTALINSDPMLSALADNGGSTQTFALLAGSPALDAGTNTGCPATDQRGIPRPIGAACDIGAYEYESTISGNAGIGGAILSYHDGVDRTATADGSGIYSIMVGYNWSGTVTPSKTGYTFDPDHKDYTDVKADQTSQHYTATAITYTISGNAGVGGAVINYTGGTTTADGGGAYIITVPYNWSGTVTPTKPGYSFTPPNRSYASIISNQTLQNFTAAAVATFGDVPTNYWSWNYIERLYAAGITGGCGGGNYCPEATVTRAQMAVFLERGMRGRSYSPPPATGTVFGDIPVSYWSAAWIEKLSSDGITGGCGGGNYCPEASVTRAQMAVFLLRAKHGASYSPPPATGDFGDVPTSYWAASWIEQLTAEGITSGCGGGNYCPEQPVSRAQMAVFLVRTFSLP